MRTTYPTIPPAAPLSVVAEELVTETITVIDKFEKLTKLELEKEFLKVGLNNEQIESLYNTGTMLETHDGKIEEETIEVTNDVKTVDINDDLLDEMK